jgi:phosphatidylethanolamine/phosphatidyl-N-methylethanolamine N-methyltransferase
MLQTRLSDPDRQVVETAYARWAPVYDKLCGPIFEPGRRSATGAAMRIGGRILEVGVGTGLSFGDYDASTEVVGIDFSEPMVAKARRRMASGLYPHVKDVMVMDAHELAFEDASFDCVVAQFVITLVADPERVLSECARVLRPGGEIILVNHLGRSFRLRASSHGRKRTAVWNCSSAGASSPWAPIHWFGSSAWVRASKRLRAD